MRSIQLFLILSCIFIFSLIAATSQSIPTITYFPPDDTITFIDKKNKLTYKPNTLSWESLSTTSRPTYLRQDIALVYENGSFLGFMNKWKSNTETLEFQKDFSPKQPGIYESISYHYSETHAGNKIRSIASMDYSSLQLDCKNTDCDLLPSDNKTNINNHFNNQPMGHHWDELLSYFNMNENVFEKLKLTQLFIYKDHPFPSLTQKETDDVINHLWEGLYANYIIELMETKEQQRAHYMPLVLFNEEEIRVLYEINGRKEQLIQKIGK